MEDTREAALQHLRELGLAYEMEEHPAVATIEEMEGLGLTGKGDVCKNLFLRDYKGRKHYLVVLDKDKRADFKTLAAQLSSTPLSFASPQRLAAYLGLEKGAVTPLGVVNDASHAVTVVIDSDLRGRRRLGVHPNVNTATVWLTPEALEQYVRSCGNPLVYLTL